MTETKQKHEIKPVLAELLRVVISGPRANTEHYVAALRKLDSFTASEYKALLPWDLRHYLSNRSYKKALNFIDSWDLES